MAPKEVNGCVKLWKRAGAEVPNFGVWPLGPQPAERGVFGHNKGVAMECVDGLDQAVNEVDAVLVTVSLSMLTYRCSWPS